MSYKWSRCLYIGPSPAHHHHFTSTSMYSKQLICNLVISGPHKPIQLTPCTRLASYPIQALDTLIRMDPDTVITRTSDQVCLRVKGTAVQMRSTTTLRMGHSTTAVLSVETRIYWGQRETSYSAILRNRRKNCTKYVVAMLITCKKKKAHACKFTDRFCADMQGVFIY